MEKYDLYRFCTEKNKYSVVSFVAALCVLRRTHANLVFQNVFPATIQIEFQNYYSYKTVYTVQRN